MTEHAPETPAPGPRPRPRGKLLLLGLIALAGAVALAAATQTWVVVDLLAGAAAFDRLEVSGQELNPSLSPIAIAGLASALALTIAGPVFRRVLGVLAALLGAGIVALGLLALIDPRAEAASAVATATGIAGDAQYELVRSVAATTWPSLAVAAGVLLATAGVLVLVLGGAWRAAGRRYQSAGAVADGSATAGAAAGDAAPDRISEWDQLSDGDDPSVG